MRLALEHALESLSGPLKHDGGDIHLVDYFDHVLYVQMVGACAHCAHAHVTLEHGIESKMMELFPEVRAVVEVKELY